MDDDGIQISVEDVTPEQALEWLSRNTHNRGLRDFNKITSKVEQFARDMRAGRWQATGDTIKFAPDGTLHDGQHRLTAQVRAGVTIRWVVARNVPFQAQEVMDIGTRRTVADALFLRSDLDGHTRSVAAIARGMLMVSSKGLVPTHPEIIEFAIKNFSELNHCADIGMRVSREIGGSVSAYAIAYWRLAQINPDQANAFFAKLETGVGIEELTDPVRHLRKRIANDRLMSLATQNRDALREALAFFYKCWNAERSGTPMSILKYNHGKEVYPEPF